jgi:hypothetical protein
LFQDWDVRVSVFPERQEILIRGTGFGGVVAMLFQLGLGSTLFGSRREERCPLLFNLGTPAFGTLDLARFIFGEGQNGGEFLFTGFTEILVLGHGILLCSDILA